MALFFTAHNIAPMILPLKKVFSKLNAPPIFLIFSNIRYSPRFMLQNYALQRIDTLVNTTSWRYFHHKLATSETTDYFSSYLCTCTGVQDRRHLGNEKKNEFLFYIPLGLHYLCTVVQERITHRTEHSVRTQTWVTPQ